MMEKSVGSVLILSAGLLLAICHSHKIHFWDLIIEGDDKLIQSRQKRSDDDAMDRSNCSNTCSQLFAISFVQAFPKQPDVFTDPVANRRFFLDNYDANNADKACKVYNRTKACFNTCSNKEPMKAYFTGSLSAVDVFCLSIYNDVKKNMPCASIHLREANITCTLKCKKYDVPNSEWDETVKLDEESLKNKSIVAGIKTTLTKSCLFLKCVSTCVKPIVTKACNVSAGNTLEKLFIGAFQSVRSYVTMVDDQMKANNITNFFPTDCKKMEPSPDAAPKYWFMI